MKTKLAHSADGKLQLCSRCGEYASRTLNICPTCHPAASREYRRLAAWIIEESHLIDIGEECRHLIGKDGRGNGFFLVNNDQMNLDRTAYREIARAAKRFGLSDTLFIFGRTCSYSGPGIEFMQLQR